jgi:uncharacterized protein YgiM (DUF1202 family)
VQRIQRIWSANLVGKVILVACGLLVLLIIVGIPVGVISLLSARRADPSASAAITATIPVTIYPFPTDTPEPTARPTAPPTPTTAPTAAPSPAPTALVTPTTPITVQLTVTDTNDFANVRSGPGLTFPILGTLNKGQTAPVIGRLANGTWWQIMFNSKPGWVYGLAVRIIGDASHIPVVTAPSGRRKQSVY